MPARCPSPVPPQTTQPAFVLLVPVLRAVRAWNAAGAQWRASKLGLLSLQGLTVAVVEEEEEQEKLKKRLKTE